MIDFELSEEQQMIRDSVGAFAREEIRPAARPADESGTIPAALISKAWQFGFVSGAIPEKFGGGGDARSAITGAIVAEELGFGDISIALHVLAPRLFAFPIVEMGTDDQRAKYLKRFAGADFAAATAAVMEPRFDFDLSAQQVSAKRDGGGLRSQRRQVLRAARRRVRFDSDLCGDRRRAKVSPASTASSFRAARRA